MEKILALSVILVGSYFLFIGPMISIFRHKREEEKHFESEFVKFNQNRFNPLNKEFYKSLHEYTYSFPMSYFSRGEIGGGNQRDGDELMTNLVRNAQARLADHQGFDRFKRGSTIIHGLGYNFTSKDNFESFVKLFLESMPVGAICLPVNKTWAVFLKREDGQVNFSFDKSILTNNDYRYLTMK